MTEDQDTIKWHLAISRHSSSECGKRERNDNDDDNLSIQKVNLIKISYNFK